YSFGKRMTVEYIKELTHPVAGVIFYRVTLDGKRLVFATDVESSNGFEPQHLEFIKGVDILIHDSMYFDSDYYSRNCSKKGYGHSTISMAIANALKGEVKRLFLFHYNPNYTDKDIEIMHKEAQEKFPRTYLSEELKNFSIRS
ncbi:MAG: hypothetical protein GY940_03685, partial [bacterium]|nr:hypothetical protein [bacterium]